MHYPVTFKDDDLESKIMGWITSDMGVKVD